METSLLLQAINQVLTGAGRPAVGELSDGLNLREDLGMDSFQLAELTVRLEDQTGVDIFADGLVNTVADVRAKLGRAS